MFFGNCHISSTRGVPIGKLTLSSYHPPGLRVVNAASESPGAGPTQLFFAATLLIWILLIRNGSVDLSDDLEELRTLNLLGQDVAPGVRALVDNVKANPARLG